MAGALPNLVLIRAPKCGTTALHYYAISHYLEDGYREEAERLRAFSGQSFAGWSV